MSAPYMGVFVSSEDIKDPERVADTVENTLKYADGFYLAGSDPEAKKFLNENPDYSMKIMGIVLERKTKGETMQSVGANAAFIQEVIRVLYSSGPTRFNEIFGADEGPKLWKRYREEFPQNPGRLICETTQQNVQKLSDYVNQTVPAKSPGIELGNILGFGMDDEDEEDEGGTDGKV